MIIVVLKVFSLYKPFNPILGETWSGSFPDGTQVYFEQTSHHPPVSHWEILGDGWKLYGYGMYSASLRGNALKGFNLSIFQYTDK